MICQLDKRPTGCGNSLLATNMVGDTVHTAFVDSSGNIWAASSTTLYKYNPSGVELLSIDFTPNDVQDIVQDNLGNIWIAVGQEAHQYTSGGGFMRTISFSLDVTALVAHPSLANIYIGTMDRLFKYTLSGTEISDYGSAGSVNALLFNSDDTIWIAGMSSIHKISSGLVGISVINTGDPVMDLRKHTDTTIWAAVGTRAKRYTANASGSLESDFDVGSLISDLDLDGSGNLWVASNNSARKYTSTGNLLCSVNEPAPVSALAISGTTVWIGVCYAGPNILTSASGHDFNVVTSGNTATFTFQIDNDGDMDLIITGINGPSDNAYSVVVADANHLDPNNLPNTIAVGAQKFLRVDFAPTDDNAHLDLISISSNASNFPTMNLSLDGDGHVPKPIIESDVNVGHFYNVDLTTSKTYDFIINNRGDLPLDISGVTNPSDPAFVFKAPDASYIDTTALPTTIAVSTSKKLRVEFTPTVERGYSASFQISSNDPVTSSLPLRVDGVGHRPKPLIRIQPLSHDFLEVDVGQSASFDFTIFNDGDLPLNIALISAPTDSMYSIENPTAEYIDITALPVSITAFSYKLLQIKFTPLDENSHPTQIIVTSNAANSPIEQIDIDGKGHISRPVFWIDPTITTIDFHDIEEGYVVSRGVRIVNEGDAPLIFDVSTSSVQFEAVDMVSNLSNITIPASDLVTPGATPNEVIIRVSFSASPAGASYSEQLMFGNINDPSASPSPINLLGNVVAPKGLEAILVFDRSGSMIEVAGERRKVDAAVIAGQLFTDLLRTDVDDRLGIVRFNTVADDLHNIEVLTAANLTTIKSKINDGSASLFPQGATSISAGMIKALNQLSTIVDPKEIRAMIVLTDGKENTPYNDGNSDIYIEDVVIPSGINVYSVGLGQAENIDQSKLSQISNVTNGMFLATGDLSGLNYFNLEKYYIQIAMNTLQNQILLDPVYSVPYQGEQNTNVTVVSSDRSLIFVVLDKVVPLRVKIESPNGDTFPNSPPPVGFGQQVISGTGYRIYKILLPHENNSLHVGMWKVNVSYPANYIPTTSINGEDRRKILTNALLSKLPVDFGLMVGVKSSFMITPQPIVAKIRVGELLPISINIQDMSLPIDNGHVTCKIRTPTGRLHELQLSLQGNGRYTGHFGHTSTPGAYSVDIHAVAETLKKEQVVREISKSYYVYGKIPDRIDHKDRVKRYGKCCQKFIRILQIIIVLISFSLLLFFIHFIIGH